MDVTSLIKNRLLLFTLRKASKIKVLLLTLLCKNRNDQLVSIQLVAFELITTHFRLNKINNPNNKPFFFIGLCWRPGHSIILTIKNNFKSPAKFNGCKIWWFKFQSNRYPTKRETPPLSVKNGVSYIIISHPFL